MRGEFRTAHVILERMNIAIILATCYLSGSIAEWLGSLGKCCWQWLSLKETHLAKLCKRIFPEFLWSTD